MIYIYIIILLIVNCNIYTHTFIYLLFIILNSLFGTEACVPLLLLKIQKEYWETLKSFLLYLNIIREDELNHVKENKEVLEILGKL